MEGVEKTLPPQFCDHRVSTLSTNISGTLKRIYFPAIAAHVRRNSGLILPPELGTLPWYYLSGFYYKNPHRINKPGHATAVLKANIAAIGEPIILCCEPVLGSDPRSMTEKNEHLTPDDRYTSLCNYYRRVFNMTNETQIDCTLYTELTGRGRRWALPERKFMWSHSSQISTPNSMWSALPPLPFHSERQLA
jgi:hypothetical protein